MARYYIENETTRFNGFYLMDSENSLSGYVIIGITYPNGDEALIDPMSISDDFGEFDAEVRSIFDYCGEHVCTRYNTLPEAYFAYLKAVKGVA